MNASESSIFKENFPHEEAVIKAVLKINEGLELGSVHKPMVGVCEADMPKVEAVAARIRAAIAKFC